jgi:hypothetical protein
MVDFEGWISKYKYPFDFGCNISGEVCFCNEVQGWPLSNAKKINGYQKFEGKLCAVRSRACRSIGMLTIKKPEA